MTEAAKTFTAKLFNIFYIEFIFNKSKAVIT